MEENDLLKGRLQAITEKHRIQESIRQKKLELDHEKLELQRLKNKVLKERWLLQDSASHNASNITQIQRLQRDLQQTRALQLNIHKIEMEVDYLEREESMISVNESFILERLKMVEKSPEDIIKEAQEHFDPDQFPVTVVIPEETLSPSGSRHSEPTPETKALFAMETNVAKNMLTGESKVLSTADVAPKEIRKHAGLKGSVDPCSAQELTASEVDQLLKRSSEHHLLNQLNQRILIRGEECWLRNQRDEQDRARSFEQNNFSGHALRNNMAETEFSMHETLRTRPQAKYLPHQEMSHSNLENRNNQSNQCPHHGNHKVQTRHHGNPRGSRCSLSHLSTLHSVQNQQAIWSKMNGSKASGYPPPRSHDQEVLAANQPQLCYTPAHHIPLTDYISVNDDQLYCPSTTCYPPCRVAHSDRPHSPFYGDDPPYTILNTIDTTEPITAIFMGFQMAMDDSEQIHGCGSALKAELVIIGDEQESCSSVGPQEKKKHGQPLPAESDNWKGSGGASMQRHGGADIGKIQKKHKACCRVC